MRFSCERFIKIKPSTPIMRPKTKDLLLKIMMGLNLTAVITSLYLTFNHYNILSKGAVCEGANLFSCSIVNTSVYSELLGMPVALYGVIWFALLSILSWKARDRESLIPKIFWLNIIGFAYVMYLIYLEFVLRTICLFCTVVHVLMAASLVLSIFLLYKSRVYKTESLL